MASNDNQVVVEEKNEIEETSINEDDQILDTRFQSYIKVYIFDIMNADIIFDDDINEPNQETKSKIFLKINNVICNKVSISGVITNVFENEKCYRIRVDDSTGKIYATLWKNLIYQDKDDVNDSLISCNSLENFKDLYDILNNIKTRTKDKTINNSIMNEPKAGDFVSLRGIVKFYRQSVNISATGCTRVQNTTEELVQIMLPAILHDKVYSIASVTSAEYNQIEISNKEILNKASFASKQHSKTSQLDSIKDKGNFLAFINKSLIKLSSSSNKNGELKSIDSLAVLNSIKNNCPIEYKYVTQKHVIEALRELELTGRIYSCEDEYHYLPILD